MCVLYLSGGNFQFRAGGFGTTNNTSTVFTFGAGAAASPAPPANPAIPAQPGATGAGFSFAQAPAFNIGYIVLFFCAIKQYILHTATVLANVFHTL